jgi:hypothetical protein
MDEAAFKLLKDEQNTAGTNVMLPVGLVRYLHLCPPRLQAEHIGRTLSHLTFDTLVGALDPVTVSAGCPVSIPVGLDMSCTRSLAGVASHLRQLSSTPETGASWAGKLVMSRSNRGPLCKA